MAFAALANTVAFVLYLFTSKSTQLPSGERAWSFLARAHGAACLSLLLGLVAGSAIFHDLTDVLGRNLTTPYQEGALRLTWGFGFNILAVLSHLLVVIVLVSTSSMPAAEWPTANNGGGDEAGAGGERTSGESSAASPSAPGKGSALKEPLLTLEEGGKA